MRQMPQDEVRNAIHAIVSRVHADFEAELAKLETEHQASLQRVREDVTREVSEKVRSEVETAAAAELAAKLEQAKAEANRASETALQQLRQELEQASEAALAQAREDAAARREASEQARQRAEEEFAARLEKAVAEERARVTGELETERSRAQADVDSQRQQYATEIEAERTIVRALTAELDQVRAALTDLDHARAAVQRLEAAQAALIEERDAAHAALTAAREARAEETLTNVRAAERQEQLVVVERLLAAVRSMGAARSLSDTLTALTIAAGNLAPRAALFIVNGQELQGWRGAGFETSPGGLRLPNDGRGVLAAATAKVAPVSTATEQAPAFAALAADRAALAVPITVGGKAVAVLYADDGASPEAETPASWPEAMEILGLHASACLSHITALRTTQAMRAKAGGGAAPSNLVEEESSARRYARLLVSEIKLYNESAVRLGREKRDLLHRLGPEIERARRMYEDRVSPAITSRGSYFQEELVHTLADGDRALLGSA